MNQKGFSPLALLLIVVLGIFIMWEMTQYFDSFSNTGKKPVVGEKPICLTGEEDNCNDSNDVFLLPE